MQSRERIKVTVLRIVGVVLIAVMVMNLTLLFMGKIEPIYFWIQTAFIAGMAYYGLPYLSRI